jgi:predicted nucleic acid-binding protein
MVLPDTSIWIAYLRTGAEAITRELNLALDRREVLACGPVVAELVAGARPSDRPALLASMAGLPWAELDHHAWQTVGLLAAELRDRGQRLPLTDLEIAIAALASGAELWTSDRHFERLSPLLDGLDLRLIPIAVPPGNPTAPAGG